MVHIADHWVQRGADAALVAAMACSSVMRARRTAHLVGMHVIPTRIDLSEVPRRAFAEALVNMLSLFGTMLADRLRHSQGLYSLAQCAADCAALAAQCPGQRHLVLGSYLLAGVAAVMAYATATFHSVGWACAWLMAGGSVGLLVTELFVGMPPLSTFSLSDGLDALVFERMAAVVAYTIYIWMLLFDEAEDPTPHADSVLAAIPMFWPWFTNVVVQLIIDALTVANVLLRPSRREVDAL